MKDKDYIWRLIARKLAGEASPEELSELEALLGKDPDKMFTLHVLDSFMKSGETAPTRSVEDAADHLMERLHQPVPQAWAARKVHKGRLLKTDLLKNQLKTTYRNILRSKTFSFINIFGLSLGMASAILLLLVIQNWLTFDRFHHNEDRIYEVYNRSVINGDIAVWSGTPIPLGPVLKSDYREVEAVARTAWIGSLMFNVGDNHLRSQGHLTDNDFLKIFNFPLQEGDATNALSKPHSIVLTPKLARKLFGDEDPLGKTINIDSNVVFTVTGVTKPLPSNTRFNFEYLVPWSYMKEIGWESKDWGYNTAHTFVLLKPGITEQAADRLFSNIASAHDPTVKNQLFLHPIRKWALYNNFVNGEAKGGTIHFVEILAMIAAFILFIACINYMNLSTARSMRRAKEVGIRKVMGAGRAALIWQFMGESMLMAAVAGVLALGVAQAVLPWFDKLMFEEYAIPYGDPRFWLAALGFVVFTGLVAGSYPALYLSAYQPIQVLKGTFKAAFGLVTPRKVLVVFQFTISITLVICTFVIYREVWFARHRDSGYVQENLLFVYINGDIKKNYDPIRSGMEATGVLSGITRTNSPVTDSWSDVSDLTWPGKPDDTRMDFTRYTTDKGFTKTIGLKILAGRDIDVEAHPDDTAAMLLSRAAVQAMGLKAPLGAVIRSLSHSWRVVGVVADFIPNSPFNPIWPIIIEGDYHNFGAISFRVAHDVNTGEALARVGEVFKKYNPNYPFEAKFVDEQYGNKFADEQHLGTLATLFSGLSICISFLGLFALAAYMAESRIREIGIRRVLGASIGNITTLLSMDFMKLILVSFAIASPLAWWAMRAWLSDYAYRVSLSWWLFAITGGASFLIALATVSYQAVSAAKVSPAESLKAE